MACLSLLTLMLFRARDCSSEAWNERNLRWAFRARIMLALGDGLSYREIERKLGASSAMIALWKSRFEQSGIAGLHGQHKGSKPRAATPAMQVPLLRRVQQKPSDGSTHWSCRKLPQELGLSKSTVQRILRQAKLKPHQPERYLASNDPEFEQKAADIIGLYLNPPQHAAVFCVDEKSAIQALDRLDPVLPLSPGRAERHGFEYYRHGTLSLYAALNVKTGAVEAKTARRHTSAEFVEFLSRLVKKARWAREIHIVLDNLSAHKTPALGEFLKDNPKVRFHFTPTYSSWLNQVEIWFAKIERDVIAREPRSARFGVLPDGRRIRCVGLSHEMSPSRAGEYARLRRTASGSTASSQRSLIEVPNHFARTERHYCRGLYLVLGQCGLQGFGKGRWSHAYSHLATRQAKRLYFANGSIGRVCSRNTHHHTKSGLSAVMFGIQRHSSGRQSGQAGLEEQTSIAPSQMAFHEQALETGQTQMTYRAHHS